MVRNDDEYNWHTIMQSSRSSGWLWEPIYHGLTRAIKSLGSTELLASTFSQPNFEHLNMYIGRPVIIREKHLSPILQYPQISALYPNVLFDQVFKAATIIEETIGKILLHLLNKYLSYHDHNKPEMKSNVSEKVKDSYPIAGIQKHKSTGCWARKGNVLTPNVG